MQHIELKSEFDTEIFAKKMAVHIHGGALFALSGPVGAGKTTFVKAFARALGIHETVVSPTYTLLQPYILPHAMNGVTQVVHVDAYRLESAEDLRAIGFTDFLHDPHTVILIEWPDHIKELLEGRHVIWLQFGFDNETRYCDVAEFQVFKK